MRRRDSYHPRDYYQRHPALKRVMEALRSNMFCASEPGLFAWFYDAILEHGDYYFHLADLESYIPTQERVTQEYMQPALWAQKAILNVARVGKFSSDRTIREYARDIWKIHSIS